MAYFEIRTRIDPKTGKKIVKHRVMIRLKGYPTKCGTFPNKTKAEHWAQQTEAAMRDGRYFKIAASKKYTLAQLIDRYLKEALQGKPKNQIAKKTLQLGWWKQQLGSYLLADITPGLIHESVEKLAQGTTYRHKTRAPATVVRYLAALSHVFRRSINNYGWLESNPVARVDKPTEPRGRVRYLSDEERKNLLEACRASSNPYLYTVVVVLLATGARKMEILSLKWADVNLQEGRLVFHHTKNKERRAVPIVGLGLELLRQQFQKREGTSELVFPGKDPTKPINIRSAWEAALQQSGVKNFLIHDLRHSAASYLCMSQASLSEIAEILGHKSLQMVKRYTHVSESHVAGVLERMNDRIFN